MAGGPTLEEHPPSCEISSSARPRFGTRAQKTGLSFSYCRFPKRWDRGNFGNCVYHPVWGDVLGWKTHCLCLGSTDIPGLCEPAVLGTAFVYHRAAITGLIVEIPFEKGKKKTKGRKKRNCHLQLQTPKPSGAPDTSVTAAARRRSSHRRWASSPSAHFSNPVRILFSVIYTRSQHLRPLAAKQIFLNKFSPSLSVYPTDHSLINGVTF